MSELFLPNAELVVIGWIKGISGVPANQINSTVPSVDNQDFADNGFIQVQAIGGTPNAYTFMQNSTMQIDCWAFNKNSQKVPWGKAYQLASVIKEGLKSAARHIETPAQYHDAYVHEVRVLVDPRRLFDNNDAGMARYSMDIVCHWAEAVAA